MTTCNSCIHWGFCEVFYSEGAEHCTSFKHNTEEMTMKIMLEEGAKMPQFAHTWDGGLDLCSNEDGYIRCNHYHTFNTGIHMAIPEGCVGLLRSRSGMTVNHGVTCGEGTIDAHYTGPIKVCLFNRGGRKYEVKKGDKIAQLVIVKCEHPELELVDSLEETDRGDNGFGSTGR